MLPSDDDHTHLANAFASFFESKIDNIREFFNLNVNLDEQLPPEFSLNSLKPATYEEIRRLIISYSNKSCELDPIPTWLLKESRP